jgi:hypothetical protein
MAYSLKLAISFFGLASFNLCLSSMSIVPSLNNGLSKGDTCLQAPPSLLTLFKPVATVLFSYRPWRRLAVVQAPITGSELAIPAPGCSCCIFWGSIFFSSPGTGPRYARSPPRPSPLRAPGAFLRTVECAGLRHGCRNTAARGVRADATAGNGHNAQQHLNPVGGGPACQAF